MKRKIKKDTVPGGKIREGILVRFEDLQRKKQMEQEFLRLVDEFGKALKNFDKERMINLWEEQHGVTLYAEDLKVIDDMLKTEKRLQDTMEKSEHVNVNFRK